MSEFFSSHWPEMLRLTCEHLALVFISITLAILIGVPSGILLTRRPALQRPVIGLANILQTVPSLALFGFLMPLLGIGPVNAIVALVLYSLLPLIRNTVTGIQGVDPGVREAAVAMGMTDGQVLRQVELPLAAGVILAGVRVATVLCVGVTTIASYIAAGGLGQYIYTGLRANDNAETLAGAIPAALLALGADAALGFYQQHLESARQPRALTSPSLLHRLAWAPPAALLVLGAVGTVVGVRSLLGNAGSLGQAGGAAPVLTVASKDFTESRLLTEILAQMAEKQGIVVRRTGQLGGSLCHQAVTSGRIDCYPEYTGTAFIDILKHQRQTDPQKVLDAVRREYGQRFHLAVSAPLGFEDTFAMLVRGGDARELHLSKMSQVAAYAPKWVAGFGPDFVRRPDGYPGLARTYNLTFARIRAMDLSLINRALAQHQVDIIAGNSTDGLIPALGLVQLEDDRHYFPPYQAVYVVREPTLRRLPALRKVLARIVISTAEMQRLNYQVDGKKRQVDEVAREFVAQQK